MPTTQVISSPTSSPHLGSSEILLQTILIAIDFSEQSSRALKDGIAIAQCFGAQLLLVHAACAPTYGAGMEFVPVETFEVELEAAKGRMVDLISREPALTQLRHQEFVAYGRAADLVRQVVHEHKVDLVVAGSHGANGMERLALGSVAESLLAIVSCPVMIVGPSCHGAPHPFRSILFATDLDTTGLRSAQFASSFAERFHGQLTLLHVIEKKSRRFAVQPELAEDAVRAELSSLLPPDIEVYTNATIRVEHGKAGEIIPQVARTVCASLIVTGAGNHTSLGDHCPWSTLSEVIRESPCPVLTVQSHLR